MELAKKENNNYNKKIDNKKTKSNSSTKDEVPIWFDKEIKKENMSAEDQAEMDELFSRFG